MPVNHGLARLAFNANAEFTAPGVTAIVPFALITQVNCTTHFVDVVPFTTLINPFETAIFVPIFTIPVTVVDANKGVYVVDNSDIVLQFAIFWSQYLVDHIALETNQLPTTWNFWVGLFVPIPTCPEL